VKKLTIVVNCTERKSQPPTPQLQARSLPAGDVDERVRHWRRQVDGAVPSSPLIDLYQGEAWQQVRGLADDAARLGFGVRLLVASAGLGLRDVDSKAPAYAATFAGGHQDTVAPPGPESKLWWRKLEEFDDSDSLVKIADSRTLLVLSENYARAMDEDLTDLASRGGDLLLVGGAKTVEGLPRIAADMGLRPQLGGTASSITLRMARRWLVRRKGHDLYDASDARRWSRWSRSVSYLERYDRRPISDDDARAHIVRLKKTDPSLSATRALRILRDDGTACEQQRFAQLFRTTEIPL